MSSLNYIAILGRQPELGLVELESLLGADGVQPFGRQAALIRDALKIDRLGGSLKIAEVLYRGPVVPLRELPVMVDELPMRASKTPFALSIYGLRETPLGVMAAGLELKKQLKVRGSVRLVMAAKGLAVTAAELLYNHVIEDGFELVVVAGAGEMVVARTLGVQDIDWYSKRDYDRPARSAKVGMLPPKLAQILVNTTTAPTVADPFCGTGVVPQETLLLGREAFGSDKAAEMAEAARTNLAWLATVAPTPLPRWRLEAHDARQLKLPAACAVVSEGYLGPNLSEPPAPSQLGKMKRELMDLYEVSLKNFARQLPVGGEVSMCAPAWRIGKRWYYLDLVDELPDLGYTLKGFKHVHAPLLYARDDQIVGRQLLLLRKN